MHSRWRALAILAMLGLAVATPSATVAVEPGVRLQFTEARAFWLKTTSDPCVEHQLIVGVREYANFHAIGSREKPEWPGPRFVWAVSQDWNPCTGTVSNSGFGDTPLAEGDYALDGLKTAELRGVPVTVTDELGSRTYVFDLEWVGNRDISPWIIINGIKAPAPGVGFGSGGRWIERYVTAQATGSVGSSEGPQFDQADMWLAELGQGTELATPAP